MDVEDSMAGQAHTPMVEEVIDNHHSQSQVSSSQLAKQESVSLTTHVEKLTGENYGVWKFQMSIMFRARKLMGFVDGSLPREAHDDVNEWADKDAICQSIIISAVESKLMRRLMMCGTAHQMWHKLSTVHEQNATENIQLLQQQFFDLKMKPSTNVVDHISAVEQLVNQLTDLGEPVSEQAVICKVICSLPPSFKYLTAAWDSVPRNQQTIEALTLRLLKEEARNRLQDEVDGEGEKAFFSRGQSSGGSQKLVTAEEKKKRAAKIAELKKKTKCNSCGRKGHWEKDAECPENKKKSRQGAKVEKKLDTKADAKSEANAVTSNDADEDDNSAFMVHANDEKDKDAWYMDGGATEHMTDRLEWFQTFTEVAEGRWPVMIADNRRLWV